MNKKIYSTPTTSIVRGSELMQDTPPDDDDGFPAMHDAFQTRKAWKD